MTVFPIIFRSLWRPQFVRGEQTRDASYVAYRVTHCAEHPNVINSRDDIDPPALIVNLNASMYYSRAGLSLDLTTHVRPGVSPCRFPFCIYNLWLGDVSGAQQ